MGTSPPARGRRGQSGQVGVPAGNTPACAGKTGAGLTFCTSTREHSRLRGEDTVLLIKQGPTLGTPPPARGRRRQCRARSVATGNTPACAGKTGCRVRGHPPTPEHPRLRGEDPPASTACAGITGTTPACAGKTTTRLPATRGCREHPRLRGEDTAHTSIVSSEVGTPPPARGRRGEPGPHAGQRGNTPACAGKTASASGRSDHWWWNTPTCAGKTADSVTASPTTGEHPRLRGEDFVNFLGRLADGGTPPPARGRRGRRGPRAPRHGNTPACAGKTRP